MIILATWADEVVKILTAVAGCTGLVVALLSYASARHAKKESTGAKNTANEAKEGMALAKQDAVEAKVVAQTAVTTQGQSLDRLAAGLHAAQNKIADIAQSMPPSPPPPPQQ